MSQKPDYELLAKGVVDLVTTIPCSRGDLERRQAFMAELMVVKLMDTESHNSVYVVRRESGEKVFLLSAKQEARFGNIVFARAVRDAYIAKFPAAKLEILLRLVD